MGKYLDSSGLTHLISKFKAGGINMPASTINSGTFDAARIPSLPASKITSGTIDIARLPAAALERCKIVADESAAKLLTVNDVQLGDTVKITGTKKMYMVVDTSKLSSDGTTAGSMDAYTEYVTSTDWSTITNKPTVLTSIAHSHGLTIGSSTKSVNANSTQTWTLAEIGAAAASHTHTKSQITDFPSSLKNPNSLTIKLNGGSTEGTNLFTYDGSSAKSLNITASSIGAITSVNHNHTIKIGNSSKSVSANGSQSWTVDDIGWKAVYSNTVDSFHNGMALYYDKASTASTADSLSNRGFIIALTISNGYVQYRLMNGHWKIRSYDNSSSEWSVWNDTGQAVTDLVVGGSGTDDNAAATNPYMILRDDDIVRSIVQFKGGGSTTVASDDGGVITISSTDTHYTTKIVAGASNSASSNAAATSPYVNLFDDSTKRSSLQFKGSGGTTVSSDANGVITIKSNTYTSDSALSDTEIDTAIAAAT